MNSKTDNAPDANDSGSPFNTAARDLVELGFHVVPLEPRKKSPGNIDRGEWRPMFDWQRFRDRQPTEFEWSCWQNWQGANVGVVCGSSIGADQVVAIDIDTDDIDEIEEILAALPRSPMAKKGAKGLTLFYRGDADLVTRKYDREGRQSLLEILTGRDTRQTVVPPSIHPITGTAYHWVRGPVTADELPGLTVEDVEALEETLQSLGWDQFASEKAYGAKHFGAARADLLDGPFAELNRAALDNLDSWVHDLGLDDLKKARRGYECVNVWRESSSGRALHQRKKNLSIQPTGIADWGSNERFSPIDLVMMAKGLSFDNAFTWLHEKVFGETPPLTLPLTQHKFEPTVDDTSAAGEDDDQGDGEDASSVVDFSSLVANGQKKKEEEDTLDAPVADDDPITDAPIYPPFAADAALRRWRDLPPNWLVSRIVEWVTDGAPKPLPALAIGAALSTISTAIGRQYQTPRSGSTALYILALAESGTGKNRPLRAPSKILDAAGMASMVGPSSWTAASVLENALKDCPNMLMVNDEFGDTLAKMAAYNASGAEQSKFRALKELFSIDFDTYKTQAMAANASSDIRAPHLSIMAASTPGKFYSALSGERVEDGFLNRWLPLFDEPEIDQANERRAEQALFAEMTGEGGAVASAAPVPKAITDGLRRIHRRRDNPNASGVAPSLAAVVGLMQIEPERVWASREAVATYSGYMKHCGDDVRESRPDLANLYVRAAEIALRIATILAVADLVDSELEADRIEIDDAQMTWACRFVDWAVRRNASEVSQRLNEGRNAKLLERMGDYMSGKAGQWVERRLLVKRFMKEVRSSRELDEMLQTLVDAGRLDVTQKATRADGRGGRATTLFKFKG